MSTETTAAISTPRANPVIRLIKNRPEIILVPLLFIIVTTGWEIAIHWMDVPIYIFPAPSNIFYALVERLGNGLYIEHAWYTLSEALLGFPLAMVGGIVIGSFIAQFRIVEKTLYPYLFAIQTTPKVAIAPLFILWFGFGITSKIIIAAMIAFFPILVNVIAGLRSTDPQQIDLMRSLQATRWQIFVTVRLPSALPMIFAGLQIAIIFSILGAIVGEFVGSNKGLGNLILQMNFNLDTAGVFGALVCLSTIGICLHLIMKFIQKKLLFWSNDSNVPSA